MDPFLVDAPPLFVPSGMSDNNVNKIYLYKSKVNYDQGEQTGRKGGTQKEVMKDEHRQVAETAVSPQPWGEQGKRQNG